MASITRLGFQNSVITGALSAGSAALPVVNLASQLGSPATGWQTVSGIVTSASGAWVRGNSLLTNTAFSAFSVHRTNLTASATIRARVWSDYYSTLVYDSGTVSAGILSGFGQSVLLPASPVAGQYWQIDIDDPANPDGFINVPLMYVGALFAPTIGLAAQTSNQTVISSASATTKFGQVYVNSYWQARQATPALGYLTDAEMSSMANLDTVCRDGTNILYVPDASGLGFVNRDTIFGVCTSGAYSYSFTHRNARNWSGQILERI